MTETAHPLPLAREALHTAIFEALGAVSVCWESLAGTGEFQSSRAKAIGDELVSDVEELTAFGKPSLGLATTAELVEELAARFADPVSSRPEYRTVGA